MSCEYVQELISLLTDGKLPAAERESVLAHTGACRNCGAHLEAIERQRGLLSKMAQSPVPLRLAARLKVLASHERERQLARVSIRERVRRLAANVELGFDNMMRPVALPFTGGLLSTLLLFGFLMPTLSFSHPNIGGYEFRTLPRGSTLTPEEKLGRAIFGEKTDGDGWDAGYDDSPLFAPPDEPSSDYVNIVNLTIDEHGKVVDWSIVRGQLTDEMKNIIVLGQFEPATVLGVRTSGIIQVRQSLPPCKYSPCSATVRG